MDTDIDNYSNNEILHLLKLNNDNTLNVNSLFEKVSYTLDKLSGSNVQELDNILTFFRNCFVRVCIFKGWNISEEMRSGLNLDPLPRIQENIETKPDKKDIYVNKILYKGSVPLGVPELTSINTHNLEYTRGDVNPLDRESVTTLLTINSKFRPEYNEKSIITQGDRINDIVRTRNNSHTYNKINKNLNCNNNVTGGYIGNTSDFTIELKHSFKDVVSMKLSGIELMNGYYPISSYYGSNIFTITTFEYDLSASLTCPILDLSTNDISNIVQTPIQIGQGSYDINQLQTTFNAIFSQPTNHNALKALRTSYNAITGKIRFFIADPDHSCNPIIPAPPANKGFGFNLDFRYPENPERNLYYNLGWMLGYRKGYYDFCKDYIDASNTTMSLLVGFNPEAAANLIGTPYFLLEVNDFNNNNSAGLNYNCNTEHFFNIRNILAKIPNTFK